MKNICVFCGSSFGIHPEYSEAAVALGQALVDQQIGLIYGGGNVGLMGEIARTVFEQGGHVTGVIPKALADREVAYTELTDLRIVKDMHERKALMADLADGFIAMPGGFGTLEEFFEAITWSQLAIHNKPCGLLNIGNFYDLLIRFLDHTVEHGFVPQANRNMILMDANPQKLIEKLRHYAPATLDKAKLALQHKKEREA